MELRRIERLGTCECKSCSSRSLSSQRRKEAPDDRRMSAQPRCGVIQSEWRRERSLPRNAHTSRRHLRAVRTSLHGSRPGAQAKFGKLGRRGEKLGTDVFVQRHGGKKYKELEGSVWRRLCGSFNRSRSRNAKPVNLSVKLATLSKQRNICSRSI